MWHFKAPLIAMTVLLSTACSTVSPPSYKLEPPSARLLKAPEPLPEVGEGDDLYDAHARLRASYTRTAGQAVGLQKYVRTVLKKQKGAP